MKFTLHTIQKPLIDFIESIFHFEGFMPEHSIERVVPTGHIFIIFELDDITRQTFDNDSLEPSGKYTKAWVSGNHKNYISISAHKNSEMLVIQLKPNGFYPLLHKSVDIIKDKIIPAQNIFGNKILELRKNIVDAIQLDEKFKLVDDWTLNRFDINLVPNDELNEVVHQLQTKPFDLHSEIIGSYSKTQKHLISQFKKYYGLTPKVMHRIYRFNEILKEIRQQQKIYWPQITYQFGYSDQSHFIKEFKEFSGFNPQEFIMSKYNKEEPNFFPIDKRG